MHDGAVADGDALADRDGAIVVGMEHHVVLHVAQGADGDGSHLGAHDGVEPDGAVLAERHVAADRRVLRDVGRFIDIGTHSLELDDHFGSSIHVGYY